MLQERSKIDSVSSISERPLFRCECAFIMSQTKMMLLVLFMLRSLNWASLYPKNLLNGQRRSKFMRFLWPIVRADSSEGMAKIWIVPRRVNSLSYFAFIVDIFFLAAATRWKFWAYCTMAKVCTDFIINGRLIENDQDIRLSRWIITKFILKCLSLSFTLKFTDSINFIDNQITPTPLH